MALKRTTRKRLAILVTCIALGILGAIGATFYLMQSVFEADLIIDPSSVPHSVLSSWRNEFPGAGKVQWKFDEDLFEAKFDWQDDNDIEAYFNHQGICVKKEFPAEFEDLPLKVQQYLQAQKGYKVEDIEHVEELHSSAAFEVELVGRLSEYECLFDAEGNLVSKIRDGAVLDPPPPPRTIVLPPKS